jgi:spore germination cell wall hydrolase CwlJ-like protein
MTLDEARRAVAKLPARAVMALTVWSESRGEPLAGQTAVAWVIKNRAANRKQTIQKVCLAPWQFSCWWEDSANARTLAARAESMLAGRILPEPTWLDLLQRCHQILLGNVPDPTGGADHYLTTALYRAHNAPTWARKMRVTAVIGRHTFLRDERVEEP